jgi:predicted signal transduction protein with EAL and GGDEF domain
VQEAEQRIHTLEAKLQHMSELVREDQLTGSLNRRGLDDVFERESARADRRGTPLCMALLDLDNFKKLNDTYGHLAGDGPCAPGEDRQGHAALDGRDRPLRRRGIPDPAAGNHGRGGRQRP